MKVLKIENFIPCVNNAKQESFAVQTNEGVAFFTKSFLERRAQAAGTTLKNVLKYKNLYNLSVEKTVMRKAGVPFEYEDADGNKKTATPKKDRLEVGNIAFELNTAGAQVSMNAEAYAEAIGAQFAISSELVSNAVQSQEKPIEIED